MNIVEIKNREEKKDKDKLVFHYFCDEISPYEIGIAKIILFEGKTGTGKTTAIKFIC